MNPETEQMLEQWLASHYSPDENLVRKLANNKGCLLFLLDHLCIENLQNAQILHAFLQKRTQA